MGLFDIFKKKKTEVKNPTPTVVSNSTTVCVEKPRVVHHDPATEGRNGTFIQRHNVTVYKEEPVTHDTGYGVTVTTQVGETYTVYDYNEVLAYAIFFDRYKVVKAPEYMHEPDYVHFQFMNAGVKDIHKLHIELFEKGFYKPANVEEILSIYKVGEIKQVASTLGIAVSGKKDDVIKTIAQNSTPEIVQSILNTKIYSLADKALAYLNEHEIEIEYYTRGSDEMSLEEYIAMRGCKSKKQLRLEELESDLSKKDNDTFHCYTYSGLADIYKDDGNVTKAMEYYLRSLYIKLSGSLFNYINWKEAKRTFKNNPEGRRRFMVNSFYRIKFKESTTNNVRELMEHFNPSMIEFACGVKLPIVACPKEMFIEIISLIQKGKLDRSIYKKIEETLNENLRKIAETID